ncbi:MAG: phosphoribosyltransferase family protein [Pseudomonadota bacterium]|nr:phosphoribosyltransferase family protein [Pseudomonadota bacterium]
MQFADRSAAGEALAQALTPRCRRTGQLVLALPRGGVPVAVPVARKLECELDLLLVRKLGVPWQPELAAGAIADGGVRILNEEIIRVAGLSDTQIDEIAERELRELERRSRLYREDRPAPQLRDRDLILVDDGLATGATMKAAVAVARAAGATSITVAVPVAPAETLREFSLLVDELICLSTPRQFFGVGQGYGDFRQVSDDEVRCALKSTWKDTE